MTTYNVTVEELRNIVTTSAATPDTVYVKILATAGGQQGGLLTGSTEPNAATGAEGNWYIWQMGSGEARLFGPKASGAWPSAYIALTGADRYIHTQGSAATAWTVTHALGGHPSVTVVDSTGTVVIGGVQYDSETQVTLTFSAAFSGSAYLT